MDLGSQGMVRRGVHYLFTGRRDGQPTAALRLAVDRVKTPLWRSCLFFSLAHTPVALVAWSNTLLMKRLPQQKRPQYKHLRTVVITHYCDYILLSLPIVVKYFEVILLSLPNFLALIAHRCELHVVITLCCRLHVTVITHGC